MAGIEQPRARLGAGLVIPACPLALNARRKLDERRQRALFRYYIAAGAGGLAVGVHTTQFAIREPKVGLFKPVLELATEELRGSRREEAHSAKSQMRNPKPARRSRNLTTNRIQSAGCAGIIWKSESDTRFIRPCNAGWLFPPARWL